MARRVGPLVAAGFAALLISGCSTVEQPRRAAWRAEAEKACIAEHRIRLSRYLQPRGTPIDGPGVCGLTEPFMVGALSDDRVQLDSVATLDCPMIAALDEWIDKVVQPAAQARFGQPVAQIDTMGSYSCRGMNGQAGAKISEHAFGNAIDIAGFRFADGRRLTVVRDWTRGDEQSQAFLRDVHAGACETFTTVLGPGANIFHYNHIHLDLAQHGNASRPSRHICKPVPDASRPPPPRFDAAPSASEDEQDVAGGGGSLAVGGGTVAERGGADLDTGSPPPYRGAGLPSRAAAANAMPVPGSLYNRAGGAEGDPHDWDVTSSIPSRR